MLTEQQLETLNNQYLPVTKAPTFSQLMGELPMSEDLHCESSMRNLDDTALYNAEASKRYLACNSDGDVFLVQNPALASWQLALGAKFVSRMKPQFFMAAGDAKQFLGLLGKGGK